jgi:hypothetical protein
LAPKRNGRPRIQPKVDEHRKAGAFPAPFKTIGASPSRTVVRTLLHRVCRNEIIEVFGLLGRVRYKRRRGRTWLSSALQFHALGVNTLSNARRHKFPFLKHFLIFLILVCIIHPFRQGERRRRSGGAGERRSIFRAGTRAGRRWRQLNTFYCREIALLAILRIVPRMPDPHALVSAVYQARELSRFKRQNIESDCVGKAAIF